MESGGVVRGLLARRHAARCPSCRQSLAQLEAIRRELAPDESPLPAHRTIWKRAMAAEVPGSARPNCRVAIVAALATAALVILALGTWMTGLWRDGEQVPIGGDDPGTVEQEQMPAAIPALRAIAEQEPDDESLRRLGEMKSSLLALSQELEQLAQNASLLEERKQVVQLLADYEQR
jgi:hypothetical protein